jgi:hypothetical protein
MSYPRRHDELLQSSGVQITGGQRVAAQASANEIAARQTIVVQASAVQTAAEVRFNDPRAIYQRYVKARDAWYKAQPRGYVRMKQQYRRAIGLPLRYDKQATSGVLTISRWVSAVGNPVHIKEKGYLESEDGVTFITVQFSRKPESADKEAVDIYKS